MAVFWFTILWPSSNTIYVHTVLNIWVFSRVGLLKTVRTMNCDINSMDGFLMFSSCSDLLTTFNRIVGSHCRISVLQFCNSVGTRTNVDSFFKLINPNVVTDKC